MKLKDYLDIEKIFHPTLFYDGEWLLGGTLNLFGENEDYVMMNSKKKGKVNLYEKYLEENYYEPLGALMNSKSMVRSYKPRISFTYGEKGQKRVVLFSLPNYVFEQILSLNLFKYSLSDLFDRLGEDCTREQLISESTNLLKEEKKCFEDILINNNNSTYYKDAQEVYQFYVNSCNFNNNFNEFIKTKIVSLEKLIISNRKCLKFFEKEIDIKALLDCFDFDEFCLLLARSVLDNCKITEERKGLVDNSVCVIKEYLDAVQKLRKSNKNYYCQIVLPGDKKGRKKIVTVEDIEREYESLLARHPEFSFIETNKEQLESLLSYYGFTNEDIKSLDFSSRTGEEVFMHFFEKFKEDKELLASWIILPKGETNNNSSKTYEHNTSKDYKNIDNSEHVRRMLYGKHYLDNSPYAYKLSGTNKFEGYIGFIYPNGVVIFEKFYENEKTGRVARNSATYVMNIFNFVELSKLSRSEIVSSLKDGNLDGVYRIFHREDMEIWKQEVTRAISGSDYSKKDLDYITNLISQNTLSKGSVK